jgi:hypothetical protein
VGNLRQRVVTLPFFYVYVQEYVLHPTHPFPHHLDVLLLKNSLVFFSLKILDIIILIKANTVFNDHKGILINI